MAKLTDMPVEVLRRVAYYVKCKDYDLTLKSASRICRYLTPVFQEGLFTKVHLDDRFRSFPVTNKFYSMIRTSPHIIKYIQSFSVSLLHEDLVVYVLSNASGIKKLQFREDDEKSNTYVPRRNAYKTETRTAIVSALEKFPLTEVHLHRVSPPLSLLTVLETQEP
ncbi:hypothetical protein BDQ17DRAFT_1355824 [Cyathus striatus]|nr:hypothetical protein BDQ17DRAFT_1355824 [Cyathus striatus]